MHDIPAPGNLTSVVAPRVVAGRASVLWRAAIVAVACYATGGPWLDNAGSPVWAPTGIMLVAMLRWGLGVWPGAWLGALALGITTGLPVWLAMLLASGNTLGPLIGARLLKRSRFQVEFDRRSDLWLFGSIGIGLSMALAAGNNTFWLAAGGRIPWAGALSAWLHGWLLDAIGALLVGIPLLTLSGHAWQQAGRDRRWLSTGLIVLATLSSAALATTLSGKHPGDLLPLFFLPHLLLGWLAARNGLFAASTTALLVTIGTVLATHAGAGPFEFGEAAQGISVLAAYACSLLAMPLLSTALTGELAASERRWHLALDASQIGVGDWDLVRGTIEFSDRWLALLGHTRQSFGHSIDSFWTQLHPEDVAGVQRAFEPLHARAAVNCRAETRMLCGDASWRLFELHALVAERGVHGEPLRIVNTARDISDMQAARDGQALSQSVFQHLHEGLLITDAQHRVLEANPTFSEITGYARAEVVGLVPPLLHAGPHEHELASQLAAMSAGLDAEGTWRGELRHRRRSGEACVLQVTVTAVRGVDGRVRNHVLAIADVTHARAQFEQLQRQAHFDELTRLPNRARLAQMLQAAMDTSRREGSLLTVCYLDLDHFKPVNDQFGHEAGDRLLLELATRMLRSLRSWAGGDDVVARIGGDEFVLLLRTATVEESRHAVERVLNQVCQPYALGLGIGPLQVTASIGATIFPLDGADAETLVRHADHAMYGAKQAGRNGYLFFDAEHDRRAEARFVALGRIQEALDAGELRLFFQPKVDMRDATVLGVEALLRWQHPEQGIVSPAQFLPLIENTGLSISVGNWVLQQGIEQLARWLQAGLELTVSVNVSARHLQEPLFAKHLASLLSHYPVTVAQRLIIEVLETAALADVDYTCELMEECRTLGVRFALDDFGTGYSTFTYLKRLPIEMLKIDRSFVVNMLADREDLAIVEGVIGLSLTFGCSVVAEGVETTAQAQRLISIGCHVGQGNGIAAAMPADLVPGWVRGYRGMTPPAPRFGAV